MAIKKKREFITNILCTVFDKSWKLKVLADIDNIHNTFFIVSFYKTGPELRYMFARHVVTCNGVGP